MRDRPLDDDERAVSSGPDVSRSQVRGSALLVLGRAVALVLGIVTQVLIVRTLTKEEFGGFAYALAIASAARLLLSLGQGRLLSRFMAKYEEQQDYPRMFGAMFLAVGTIFTTSVLCIGTLYIFSDQLVGSMVNGDEAVGLVLILILLSPLEALDQVFVSLFAVFTKPRTIFFRKHLLGPGLRLVVVVCLVLADAGVVFLAVGYLLAAVIGVALYFFLLIKVLREQGLFQQFRLKQVVVPFRDVFAFSFPLITGELALLSMTVGGVVVLGWSHSLVEVAEYRAVFSPARLNTAITASFATLFLPVIARLHTRGDLDGLRRTYWHTASFVAVFTFPVFALTGPLAPVTTVALFGARYADAAPVLAWLAVGYYISVMLGLNADTLQVCGRLRYLIGVNVFIAVLNICACLLLAPRFAAVGVACANCLALTAQNLLNQWALRGSIQCGFVQSGYRLSYATIAACAGGLWAFQVLLQPNVVASAVAVAVTSGIVLLGSRRGLQLAETFPELSRLPFFTRIFGTGARA